MLHIPKGHTHDNVDIHPDISVKLNSGQLGGG